VSKVIEEIVIVKDYGKQGLAMFFPLDAANPGCICASTTLMNYEGKPRGFRPNMLSVPMTSSEECDMSYFYMGCKPAADDPRVGPFMERQRRWLKGVYAHDGVTDVRLKRVFKDTQKYRNERWKR
jgi:hypothetical protein